MFKFRYKRLAEVKEKLFEHKQRELDAAVRALDEIIGEIDKVRQEIEASFNDMISRPMTGEEFSTATAYLDYLDGKKLTFLKEKGRREERVDGLRADLLALSIELKMLEKLEVKDLAAFKKTGNKKQQKAMDDLALRNERK
jgi:flagellar export protein FliJ